MLVYTENGQECIHSKQPWTVQHVYDNDVRHYAKYLRKLLVLDGDMYRELICSLYGAPGRGGRGGIQFV